MNKVIDKKSAEHYVCGSNCISWILTETASLSVKQETMPAATREQLHYHTHAQQFFFVLKGTATFYVDGTKAVLGEQQGLQINKESSHFIANETDEPLEFIVISQPSINNDRTNIQ